MSDAFIQALADAADDELLDLTDLRAQCLAKILAGGGQIAFTTLAGQNGKSGQQECRMDAAELLAAVNQARRLSAGDAVGLTYSDFSSLGATC
ncbi:MAG TPA: hypothetical protein VGO11_19735 [Chthoniobacteraceae bacterium]|jgi:hypothetical protein|nr:hypothetical protein [Chthoniobacteraceae bacterium]